MEKVRRAVAPWSRRTIACDAVAACAAVAAVAERGMQEGQGGSVVAAAAEHAPAAAAVVPAANVGAPMAARARKDETAAATLAVRCVMQAAQAARKSDRTRARLHTAPTMEAAGAAAGLTAATAAGAAVAAAVPNTPPSPSPAFSSPARAWAAAGLQVPCAPAALESREDPGAGHSGAPAARAVAAAETCRLWAPLAGMRARGRGGSPCSRSGAAHACLLRRARETAHASGASYPLPPPSQAAAATPAPALSSHYAPTGLGQPQMQTRWQEKRHSSGAG